MVRPGRCLCLIEFERFNSAEARAWLGDDSVTDEPTLAELYERRDERSGLLRDATPAQRPAGYV